MDQAIFTTLRALIYRESGISLSPEKNQLLANRITKRLRALNVESEKKYLEILETDASGEELIQLIDAVSTNVTFFYRESAHFDFLAHKLTEYRRQGRTSVKIWCAAASSGEEPYTLAITAKEHFGQGSVQILATDICTRVLDIATKGIYSEQGVSKVAPKLRDSYFSPAVTEDGETAWEVNPDLRSMVTFKKLNLAKVPLPLRGPVDFIFCRNVMIYFDKLVRQRLVAEFERILAPGGFLVLSHSENLLGVEHSLEGIQPAVHQKAEQVRS